MMLFQASVSLILRISFFYDNVPMAEGQITGVGATVEIKVDMCLQHGSTMSSLTVVTARDRRHPDGGQQAVAQMMPLTRAIPDRMGYSISTGRGH